MCLPGSSWARRQVPGDGVGQSCLVLVEAAKRLGAVQRREHEGQLRPMVGAGEGDAQRHQQVTRTETGLLAPGAVLAEEVAGGGRREPVARRRPHTPEPRELRRGRRQRSRQLRRRRRRVQHGGGEDRRLAVGDQRRLERRRQSGRRLRRRAGRQPLREQGLVHLRREAHDVLVVEPVELGLVEDHGARREPAEVELLHEAVQAEHLVLPVRPAQQGEVVDQRLRQVAQLAEIPHRRGAVTLAELAALGPEHHGVVREGGRRRPQRLVEQHLPRRVGEVVVAADDVRDAHVAVVHDGGEVVAGDAVGTHDDEVADGAGADHDGAADEVLDDDVAVRDKQAEGRRLARREPRLDLRRREIEAAAVVARRAALRVSRRAKLLAPRLRAEAAVGPPGGQQPGGGGAVPGEPLALAVRSVRAPHTRALVPVQAQPAEILQDGVLVMPCERAASVSSTRSTNRPCACRANR